MTKRLSTHTGRRAASFIAALILAVSVSATASARTQGDATTRQLWDTGFVQQRPKTTAAKPKRTKKPVYKRATPVVAKKPAVPQASIPETLVGLTVWRLRPSTASDTGAARMLVHEPAKNQDIELTPERVDIGSPIAEGQLVRLAVETPRDGYLYVVDREVYADGSMGTPVLIFPTTRLKNGDNKVSAGQIVEIPAQTDNPNFFTLMKSRADQVSEAITLIVTSEPIDGLEIGRDATALSPAQVAGWEKEWGAPTERLDLVGGVGTTYTKEEMSAGSGSAAKLTQDDPLPQSIYRVTSKPGTPLLVTVPLKIAGKR